MVWFCLVSTTYHPQSSLKSLKYPGVHRYPYTNVDVGIVWDVERTLAGQTAEFQRKAGGDVS